MSDDETSHNDACQVVRLRQAQLAAYGEIRNYWPDGALCTCHHWWRYNSKIPPAWYVTELVGMDGN